MNTETKPKVLVVYFSLTEQSARVVEAMTQALAARGCDVAKACIEFTDERWVPKLSQFPMKRPILQLASILPAQLRHKTGKIAIPPEAQTGDYDLIVLASPTWWFQTSMPIRSYLESPEAKAVLSGKQFACVSISRRYFSVNLGQLKKLGERNGGRSTGTTHFVVAGGQVKSMLSWLGYMKHGEPQERVLGLKLPPPNLKPDFERQAWSFVDGVLDRLVAAPAASSLVVAALDQLDSILIRIADEAQQRAALADRVRRPLRLDPLRGQLLERLRHVLDRERDVPVGGAELVGVDAEVVGQLELRQSACRDAEEVVHRLVADRQLAPLLEAERLVERDRLLGVGDAVTGVNELHRALL